jgi:hypothetical protein
MMYSQPNIKILYYISLHWLLLQLVTPVAYTALKHSQMLILYLTDRHVYSVSRFPSICRTKQHITRSEHFGVGITPSSLNTGFESQQII